jgi:site-specific recombinase XerD
LKSFGKAVNKPFEKVTKEDIENYLISIKGKQEQTKGNFKVLLKVFFKWLYKTKGDAYPEIVEWIKSSVKNARRTMPDELLTVEEVLSLVNAGNSLRDKALVFTLYDSACRIGELLNVRVKDIQSDNYGVLLNVTGKTGQRKIRLMNSVNTLILWVNNHPQKNDPNAYVFCSFNRSSYGNKLTQRTVYGLLEYLAQKTGLKKHIHPHLFRHSRLTELTKKGYPEMFLRHFAGWVAKSNMPEIYINLSAKDMDKMMLEKEGVKEFSKVELVEALKPIPCPRCSEVNSATNKYCSKCAMPLDQESIVGIERENAIKKAILNNPKIMELLEASLKTSP